MANLVYRLAQLDTIKKSQRRQETFLVAGPQGRVADDGRSVSSKSTHQYSP